ncbi:hypothetical protein ACH34E_02430 [Elizabethkingia anophelis]
MNKSLLSASMLLVAASSLYAQKAKVEYRGQAKIIDIATITPTGCIMNMNDKETFFEGKCVVEFKAIGRPTERFVLKEKERLNITFIKDENKKQRSEIRIEEVQLTAKKKQFSEIEIKQEAFRIFNLFLWEMYYNNCQDSMYSHLIILSLKILYFVQPVVLL